MTNDELSLLTKTKLATALKKRMEKKILTNITVSELIRECGINRNTFYYHFDNIYDLLKWMLANEASIQLQKLNLINSIENSIIFAMEYLEENKQMILSICDSFGHEQIRTYTYELLRDIIYKTIKAVAEKHCLTVSESFLLFYTKYVTAATSSMLIEWIHNSSELDRSIVLEKVAFIYSVSIPIVLKERDKKERNNDY